MLAAIDAAPIYFMASACSFRRIAVVPQKGIAKMQATLSGQGLKLSLPAAAAVLGVFLATPANAFAQSAPLPTVVQLPTFSFFSVSTTVSVPDAGDGILGARHRASQSRRRFGPGSRLSPRAIGGGFAATDARVQAVIHDLKALDEAALSQSACPPRLTPLAPAPAQTAGASTADRPRGSVAEARARYAADVAKANDEIVSLYARAEDSESRGNMLAARARYRQVAHRARGDLKRKAIAKVRELTAAEKQTKAASRLSIDP